MIPARVIRCATFLALTPLAVAAGQGSDWDGRRPTQTRAALQDLLRRFEQAADRPGYTTALRTQARADADLIRARLAEGDFQVADRVLLWVEGEPQLSDTFTVTAGPALLLPMVGAIALRGVLHSELESHLAERLGRVLVDPVVRARSLIRMSVLGEVGRPGFYVLPVETLPEEALMAAGGPTPNARLASVRIERGDSIVWDGAALRRAMTEGRTFDDLSLRAGDRLFVPRRNSGLSGWVVRIAGLIVTTTAVYTVRDMVRRGR